MRDIKCVGWFVVVTVSMVTASCDKPDNSNKNRGGVAEPQPFNPAQMRLLEESGKTQDGNKRFNETLTKLEKEWNSYCSESQGLNNIGRKARVNRCLQHALALDPFYPSGVHPDWSDAARRVKVAWVAYLGAYLEDLDRTFTGSQADQLWGEVKRSSDNATEVMSRLAWMCLEKFKELENKDDSIPRETRYGTK